MKLNWMNLNELFEDELLLNKVYNFYLKKELIFPINENKNLVQAHLAKSKHNLAFFRKNEDDELFNDWLIVTLYYSLYHVVLSLITNKQYKSINHTASLIFLIKHYSQFKSEIKLLHNLSIDKSDAEFYTQLKTDRQNASYQTNIQFSKEQIKETKIKLINFINKVEQIIKET
ncbi:MAG: DNA-binding protein [Candidatus Woesearchaeota archaeon]